MSSVGTYLRELRQRRGVSLEEIARTTRVARGYLESIEADAFDALPDPVFTRGFIRAYCQALGEPPAEALAAYEGREGRTPQQAGTARPGPATPRSGEAEPRGRGAVLVSFVLLVVLGIALFAVALVIHPRDRSERVVADRGGESRPARPAEEPTPATAPTPAPAPATATAPRPTAPPVASPPAAPGAPTPRPATPPVTGAPPLTGTPPAPGATATPGAAAPAPRPAPTTTAPTPGASGAAPTAPAPPVAAVTTPPPGAPGLDVLASVSSPYRLVARTSETTWIRVRTEDGRMSEENVPPGEVREWISNRPFTVSIGNVGGVSFELNGRTVPPLGPKGSVIQRVVLPPEAR